MSLSDRSDIVQQAVLEVQRQFWTALKRKDAQLFEQVLADDFISRSPGQPNQARAAFITTLTSFPASVLAVDSDNLEIHVFGDLAVLSGVQLAQLQLPNGSTVTNRMMITNIFRKHQESWSMVFTHAVELPS
jgi:ketosteroid isomerase-like protein